MADTMTPIRFVQKWARAELSERAASQEHFIDLCRMLGQPTPAEHDATGAEYTFEKGAAVLGGASRGSKGEYGFADVWWRGKFAWEYKRKGKYGDLAEAYRQLCQYREALDNPPLLIVSDIARTEIHTNFTGTAKQVHAVALERIAEPDALDLLRRVFTDPGSFRPQTTAANVTEVVAGQFASLSSQLAAQGHHPHTVAHFLMRCMFCLFAEDIGLLPGKVFERLLQSLLKSPARSAEALSSLFAQMRTGGMFGPDEIPHFNGGLFDEAPALPLGESEIRSLLAAATADWASVEPAIFGTLFERSLDPDKRAQIGAHYTSREDILLVVEPVVMAPLRREWVQAQADVESQLARRRTAKTADTKRKADKAIQKSLDDFVHRLASVQILDPACGSGNFLYVAIQKLLELEKEVITYATRADIAVNMFPQVRPTQLHGIELNPYAAELAQVVIWIGYLQWMRDNGFIQGLRRPILEPLQSVACRDAILAWEDEAGRPIPAWREGAVCRGPATWPAADFIIGNPPFLGTKMLRSGLGDAYVEALFHTYEDRIPGFSDLCCYWFELGRESVESRGDVRAGLLATQAIRNGAARRVLERIKKSGDIFHAWSDRQWVLDGAAVHISIVAFDDGRETYRELDGRPAQCINADLTIGADTSTSRTLPENNGVAFVGDVKGGPFDVSLAAAREMIAEPAPNGRALLDVIRPYANGLDITRRSRACWVVDFGVDMPQEEAAGYGAPFESVVRTVKPMREKGRPSRKEWWLHMRPCPSMREAVEHLGRYPATPTLTKHRLFVWMSGRTLPDHQLVVFGRSDDYFFGVLHSSVHELWARRTGTQLREAESGFRYTPTSCFETFALPWSPGKEPVGDAAHARISEAAKELNEQRERWLNPPEWIEPIARAVDADDDFSDVPAAARPWVRQSAILARAAKDANLKRRTLTNLYNERPTWLRLAHEELDRAVLAAYAAVDPAGGWSEDWAEVWVETGAGQPPAEGHPLASRRAEVDQQVLGALLRLNLARGGGR
jgi:hypothetical protein